MIKSFTVESFKSLDHVEVELGQVNVFVGANGSGKSNLLEAIGVLSAAADGRVDDQRLLMRGVRPGVPALYKSSFRRNASGKPRSARRPPHLTFAATGGDVGYRVTLHHPSDEHNVTEDSFDELSKPWRYKTEVLTSEGNNIVGRSPASKEKPNREQGIAALKAVELPASSKAYHFLRSLQQYAIYTPSTAVLRGTAPESQPRSPVGLSGGGLPDAIFSLFRRHNWNARTERVIDESIELIDWATAYAASSATSLPLSPAARASGKIIRFVDRFMDETGNRNVLSGYDASEGALYVIFLVVLAAHRDSPPIFAVDNADHGLNPRLARSLMQRLCGWYLKEFPGRQILLTTHNPLVLDGLPLLDDRVRLFTVARDLTGRTVVQRVMVTEELLTASKDGNIPLSQLWVMGHLGGVPDV